MGVLVVHIILPFIDYRWVSKNRSSICFWYVKDMEHFYRIVLFTSNIISDYKM